MGILTQTKSGKIEALCNQIIAELNIILKDNAPGSQTYAVAHNAKAKVEQVWNIISQFKTVETNELKRLLGLITQE